MPLKIEVTAEVSTRKTQHGEFRKQVAYAFLAGSKYPQQFMLPLDRGQEPIAAGVYTVSDKVFRIETEYGENSIAMRLTASPEYLVSVAGQSAPALKTA